MTHAANGGAALEMPDLPCQQQSFRFVCAAHSACAPLVALLLRCRTSLPACMLSWSILCSLETEAWDASFHRPFTMHPCVWQSSHTSTATNLTHKKRAAPGGVQRVAKRKRSFTRCRAATGEPSRSALLSALCWSGSSFEASFAQHCTGQRVWHTC
jgi:hypothetical protein